jgi:hypothetical protein
MGVGGWKHFGVGLRNRNCRVKKLRGNEFGEMLTAASKCFAVVPASDNVTIEI